MSGHLVPSSSTPQSSSTSSSSTSGTATPSASSNASPNLANSPASSIASGASRPEQDALRKLLEVPKTFNLFGGPPVDSSFALKTNLNKAVNKALRIQDEMEKAEVKLAEEREQKNALQEKRMSEQAELAEAKKKLDDNEKAQAAGRKTTEDLQKKLTSEQKVLEVAKKSLNVAQQEKQELEKKLGQTRIEKEALDKKLAETRNESQKSVAKHKQDFHALSAEHTSAEQKLRELSYYLDVERERNAALESRNAQIEDQCKQMRSEDDIRNEMTERFARHVITNTLRELAKVYDIRPLTVDTIPRDLRSSFWNEFTGQITKERLIDQILMYYGHPPMDRQMINNQGAANAKNVHLQPPHNNDTQMPHIGGGMMSATQTAEGVPPIEQTTPNGRPHSSAQSFPPSSSSKTGESRKAEPFPETMKGTVPTIGQQEKFVEDGKRFQQENLPALQSTPTPLLNHSSEPFSSARFVLPYQRNIAHKDTIPESMGVVETPDQPVICKYIFRPKGCQNENCSYSHPGEIVCLLAKEPVSILRSEVSPAKFQMVKAEEEWTAQRGAIESEQHLYEAKLQYVQAHYKFIVSAADDAIQANLNRENRKVFLGLLEFHVQQLGKVLDGIPAHYMRSFVMPDDKLYDIADNIEPWFSSEFNMPKNLHSILEALRTLDQKIGEQCISPRDVALTAGTPRSSLEKSLDDIIMRRVTTDGPSVKRPQNDAQAEPAPASRPFGRSHPRRLPNGTPFPGGGTSAPSNRTGISPSNIERPLPGGIMGGRIEKDNVYRQPPRAPRAMLNSANAGLILQQQLSNAARNQNRNSMGHHQVRFPILSPR